MKYWSDLSKWIRHMSNRHDGVVYDNELDRSWDWGQALCRGLYGTDWGNHPDFLEANEALYPPKEAGELAKEWERGNFPDWLEIPPMRKGWK